MDFTLEQLVAATKGRLIYNGKNNNLRINKIETDSRKNCKNSIFVAIPGEIFDGHDFINKALENNASAICIEEKKINYINNISVPILVVEDTIKAYQEIAHYYRKTLKNCKIIGLTGSNGKTSTKDILYCILSNEFGPDNVYATKSNTNNHIGVPQNLLNLTDQHKYAIIEMGTNHFGELEALSKTAEPDIAVLTSIGPSHLEFFKDLKGVAKEKSSIFKYFNKATENYAVIPFVCPEIDYIKKSIPHTVKIKTFGFDINADISIGHFKTSLNSSEFEVNWKNKTSCEVSTTLTGQHQALNAAAAITLCSIIDIKYESIVKSLVSPKITSGRMERSLFYDIICINDAYNANPSSTNAGLNYISEIAQYYKPYNKIHIVLGDMLELGENALAENRKALQQALSISGTISVYAVGTIMQEACRELKSSNIISLKNKEEAKYTLLNKVMKNDIIYLKSSNGTGLKEIEQFLKKNMHKSQK